MRKTKAAKKATDPMKDSTTATMFEDMGEDFVIPRKARSGAWDPVVRDLHADGNKGRVKKLFEAPGHTDADAQPVYSKAKALKNAAKRLGYKVLVAVRVMDGKTVLLARAQ